MTTAQDKRLSKTCAQYCTREHGWTGEARKDCRQSKHRCLMCARILKSLDKDGLTKSERELGEAMVEEIRAAMR